MDVDEIQHRHRLRHPAMTRILTACLLAGLMLPGWAPLPTGLTLRSSRAAAIADLPASGDPTTAPATQPDTGSSTQPASRPATRPTSQSALEPALRTIRGSEGFWQLVEDANGVWWFRSPSGQLDFLNSVTTVQPFQLARDPQGPHFVSRDYDGGATPDGDINAWAAATLERVRGVGFKGLGAWCHPVFHEYDMPFSRDLNVWLWMLPDAKRIYSPAWRRTAEHAIRNQVEPLRDHRQLVGYYTDNEIEWGEGFVGPRQYFNHLPPDDPNRAEVLKVIQGLWPGVDEFNKEWGTDLPSWTALQLLPELPDASGPYHRLSSAFLEHVARDYFRMTTELIRTHDPNHLILGVRFKGWAPPEVIRACRDYTDAVSINYYVSDGKLDAEMFQSMHELSGQPVIVGEYSFHALDGRSGNRNTVGFVAQVLDQQARADAYKLFTRRMARVPYIVGGDWFQWMDEPPSGRSSDGEDVNFGVVDVDDRPYELLVAAVRATAPLLNSIHADSHSADQRNVWRESFANKPSMRVPFLDRPIVLNGELSDWPAETRVPELRLAQTVGLERSPLPRPNVHLAWNHDGLYVALEVFDDDIQGAPSDWWWTRDAAEFWINTRPPAPDQRHYDRHSHQFFFVPQELPTRDGVAGVVGQWKRDGDALADHLVPHPGIRESIRIHHNRYVVEMFIPRTALAEFDPQKQPELAFNFAARNFQHATAYYWSAPKEVLTQHRPNTWGTLYLEPPATIRGALAE